MSKPCPICHGTGDNLEAKAVPSPAGGSQYVKVRRMCTTCLGSGYVRSDNDAQKDTSSNPSHVTSKKDTVDELSNLIGFVAFFGICYVMIELLHKELTVSLVVGAVVAFVVPKILSGPLRFLMQAFLALAKIAFWLAVVFVILIFLISFPILFLSS